MATSGFTTSILVDQSTEEVFDAIMNVQDWWFGDIKGNTKQLNDEFSYRVGEVHFSKQKIIGVVPQKRVEWLVSDSNLGFIKDTAEWTGTTISFDISKEGNKTRVVFTHHGLLPELECYDACSNAWTEIIQRSLSSLIKTGKGVKIF